MAILFDFDEVVVNINPAALDYVNERLKTNYTEQDLKTWDFFEQEKVKPLFMEFLLLPNLYQDYAIPNKKMIGIMKQLIDSGEKVFILTASMEGSHESKEKFIHEKMSFFDIDNVFVINSSSKYKVKSEVLNDLNLNYHEPIVLIDDGVHNVLDMMADIKHKEKLDVMMGSLYNTKKLNKFNNPYHDFIYGIIPEQNYNKNIVDGKRIFKIQDAGEIWKILKSVRSTHSNRISKKQNEIFFYFNEILDVFLEQENKHSAQKEKIISNTKYLVDYYLYNNDHKSFLNKLLEVSTKTKDLSEENKEKLFSMTETIFGEDIMYQEIKSLVQLHIGVKNTEGLKAAEFYKISSNQRDLFFTSILSDLHEVSKENISIVNSNVHKENTDVFLREKGLLVEVGIAYRANLLKALNEDLRLKNCVLERKHNLNDFINNKKKYKM